MKDEALLPCPFCGCDQISMSATVPPVMSCEQCWCEGPVAEDGDDRAAAISAWNRRAAGVAAPLSTRAIAFGIAYVSGPKATLSFGGEGAEYSITPAARAALDELLAAGYAERAEAHDSWPGREHYRGTEKAPTLWTVAFRAGFNPMRDAPSEPSFVKTS